MIDVLLAILGGMIGAVVVRPFARRYVERRRRERLLKARVRAILEDDFPRWPAQ